ncbi:MAG: DnaJ domain-containing protein [Spirochaetales bacterium]|nr:DnaJ domain-containing protein [Spirochaetales bacterium]MCF7937731.1 DnaJ domain-containing protein [Spirochaetales bacterium]
MRRFKYWGKIIGLAAGFAVARIFGAALGLVIGHIIDQLLFEYRFRKSARAFFADPSLNELPEDFQRAAVFSLAAAAALKHSGNPTLIQIEQLCAAIGDELMMGKREAYRLNLLVELALEHAAPAGQAEAGSAKGSGAQTEAGGGAAEAGGSAGVEGGAGQRERFIEAAGRHIRRQLSEREQEILFKVISQACPGCKGDKKDLRGFVRKLAEAAGIDLNRNRALIGGGGSYVRACRLLGVKPDSSLQEIKQVYRSLARDFHPDNAGVLEPEQQDTSAQAFIRIREAYETILQYHRGETLGD